MRFAAFVFVWRQQTIVWWEQTIVWWGQTIVWWEQTMAREEKNSSIAAVVAQFIGTWSRFINDRKKRLGRKGNENKRAGKIIATERFDDKQDAKKIGHGEPNDWA